MILINGQGPALHYCERSRVGRFLEIWRRGLGRAGFGEGGTSAEYNVSVPFPQLQFSVFHIEEWKVHI